MTISYEDAWPALPYDEFASTSHLLHMGVQTIGKLKLLTPFEPEWANVILYLNARGLTTGLIPYQNKAFSVDIDLIDHQIISHSIAGQSDRFPLQTMSVAELVSKILMSLKKIGVTVDINPKPQEVPKPILFNQDTETRQYEAKLANAWWRILVSSYGVMQQYHAYFVGKTQPIGLMWGTFDLRDVRFKNSNISVPATGINAGFLRRNALDSEQIESGWWSGNEAYPRAAYYSFTYPEPAGIDQAIIEPEAARWDNTLKLFVLDYDELRKNKTPDACLLQFLQSTYKAGAEKAGWDAKLIGAGKPA